MEESYEKQSAYDFIEEQIDYIIETSIRKEPYINIISKKQIWFGNGPWNDADNPELKSGLRKKLGIKIPTDIEVEQKNLIYGYPALQKPWGYLNNITNTAIRQRILWQIIDNGKYSDIRPILGRGYIRKDGTIDPEQTKGISCYVFFGADPEYRDKQNEWILNQPTWKKLQILRNISTHRELLDTKKKQASRLINNNKKLLKFMEYQSLKVVVDRALITWDDI